MPPPTTHALAQIYGTDDKQIARWKREKAPLVDVSAMHMWLAARRRAPAHLMGLSDDEQAAMQSDLDAFQGSLTPIKPKSERKPIDAAELAKIPQGAEHALRRLQGEEARLFAEMQAEDDPLRRAVIRKSWRETLLSLKQYESLVEADRRDSGETITRAQMQPVLTAFVVWFRRGVEDFINGACLQIAEAESPQSVYALIAPTCRNSIGNAWEAAMGDGKLPGWVREAGVQGL